jgi:hypothetical protein
MNKPHTLLVLLTLAVAQGICFAQNEPQRPPQRHLIQVPVPPNQTAEPQADLSQNYQITLSVTAHDKALGELSLLTCSPTVAVEGTIDLTENPTAITLRGGLVEKEGGVLVFNYSLLFTLPIVTNSQAPGPVQPGMPANMARNVQYQQHSASGAIRMKPGNSYEVLKAAGRTYSLSITLPKKE